MKGIFTFLYFFLFLNASAQISDSVQRILDKKPNDSIKMLVYKNLCWSSRYTNPAYALEYGHKALELAQKRQDYRNQASLYNYIGVVRRLLDDHKQAMLYFEKALDLAQKKGIDLELAYAYNNISSLYNISNTDRHALEFSLKALELFEKLQNQNGIAYSCTQISAAYIDRLMPEKALEYAFKALKIRQKSTDPHSEIAALNTIANIYRKMRDFEKSLIYFEKSLSRSILTSDSHNIAYVYYSKGMILYENNQFEEAEKLLVQSYEIGKKIASETRIRNSSLALSHLYRSLQNYQKAYDYHVIYKNNEDSLFKKETATEFKLFENRQHYENRLKEQEFEKKEQKIRHQLEIQQAKWFKNILILVIVSLLLLSAVIAYAYQSKQKSNRLLAQEQKNILEKNEELRLLNEEIRSTNEELNLSRIQLLKKNNDVTASINYANRIQTAILPTKQQIDSVFKENFLLFQPRDIVSGDFYWLYQKDDLAVISVADCTGHGVPGAFMSMIGSASLDKIVVEDQTTEPHLILNSLNRYIRVALRQDTSENRDGMDIVVCTFYGENKNFEKMHFAGGKNPILVVQNSEIKTLKGDRFPIGGSDYGTDLHFSFQEISLDTKTEVYLFSDGYQDQFGGKEGKKFMVKRFRELLFEIHALEMSQQHQILEKTLLEWIAESNDHQCDDITVLGLRIYGVVC